MLKRLLLFFTLVGIALGIYFQQQTIMPLFHFVTGHRTLPEPPPASEKPMGTKEQPNIAKDDFTTQHIKDIILANNLDYPPKQLAFLAFKQERILEVWQKQHHQWHPIKIFPILGASGTLGPKLREGDMQVPEGIYRITWLNHQSAFHLSLKLNYPNAFDRKYARQEGRTKPGTNIFIHGEDVSTGCIAIGNPAIEELFYLVKASGQKNIRVIIAPFDFRKKTHQIETREYDTPNWTPILYKQIQQALLPFSVSS